MKLGMIGAGKLGRTIVDGLIAGGYLAAEDVLATVRHQRSADRILQRTEGIAVELNNRRAIEEAEILVLSVKPRVLPSVLDEIAECPKSGRLVISTAASVPLSLFTEKLGREAAVVRAMPNTPCRVREGMTVLSRGDAVSDEQMEKALTIFSAVGRTMELEERHMDAVTALSASGVAFIYVVLEALAEGGVKEGLPRDVATELVAQTCLGAARMALETGQHPAVLKDEVTTPAGCTIDGLLALESGGLRVTLINAVVEATRRAGGLM